MRKDQRMIEHLPAVFPFPHKKTPMLLCKEHRVCIGYGKAKHRKMIVVRQSCIGAQQGKGTAVFGVVLPQHRLIGLIDNGREQLKETRIAALIVRRHQKAHALRIGFGIEDLCRQGEQCLTEAHTHHIGRILILFLCIERKICPCLRTKFPVCAARRQLLQSLRNVHLCRAPYLSP